MCSFKKEYSAGIINFEYIKEEWYISSEINRTKYSAITDFSPYLKICLPKQINFLMKHFESTFDKIDDDRYALTIDYIMGDCQIIITLETREYKLIVENEKLKSEILRLTELLEQKDKPKEEVKNREIEDWLLDVFEKISKTDLMFPLAIQCNSSGGWLYHNNSLLMLNGDEFIGAYKVLESILKNNLPKEIKILVKGFSVYLSGFPTLNSGCLDFQYIVGKNKSIVISKESEQQIMIYLGNFSIYARNRNTYNKIYDNRIKAE